MGEPGEKGRIVGTVGTPGVVLGVDPGSTNGGAVLLDADSVRVWWAWTWLRGKGGRYRVTRGDAGGVSVAEVTTMHDVALGLARSGPWAVAVVEGLYVPPPRRGRRVNPQSVVPLAEAAGELLGPVRASAGRLERPLASVWRRDVLGAAGATARDAEARARLWAMRALQWPCEAEGVVTESEAGAVAEAACMASWGRRRIC